MKKVALGSVAEIIAGQSPEGKFYNELGKGLPFYQGKKDFGEKFIEPARVWTAQATKLAKAGDILMSVRAPVGPVNFATGDVCIGRGLAAIRGRPDIDRDFLFYQFLHLQPAIAGNEGAVFASINKAQIGALQVVVPAFSEQQRIVTILDDAFAGIASAKANAEKNLQNARALFASHLQSVFEKRGPGWVEQRLGDVVSRLTNGFVGPTRNIYHESGVPYLLARHVKNNRLLFDGRTFISDEFNRKNKKSMLKAGDVLLVQSGHIGHSAVVTEEHEGHNCHAMIVISPVDGAFIGPFLSLFFNSSGMKEKFQEIRSGSTVPHLTCGEVRELKIPLPDLAAQHRLVAHSRELDQETQSLESLYTRKLAALDELKQSLLQQAFSGKL